MTPKLAAIAIASVLPLAACSTSPTAPAGIEGLRAVVGTTLIGARGATPADQEAIDQTAAGLCGAAVWTRTQCAEHGRRSRAEGP
jgi:hypothetical protein